MKSRAFEIRDFGIDNLSIHEVDIPSPTGNRILVKLAAASLNYRDYMVVKGQYNPKLKRPMIPLSDGAGVVQEVGPDVTRFKAGDRVAGCFFEGWVEGPPTREKTASALGGGIDGVAAEYRSWSEEALVKIPDHLSFAEAATLPCAAVTAWHALFACAPQSPGDSVLLLGTGGVSIFALQFALMAGLRVIITSSSDEKLARAKALGAHDLINYKEMPDWDVEARKLTGGEGVGKVIEVGGSDSLPLSLRSVRPMGSLAVIGVLSGREPSVSPSALLVNTLQMQGIFVGSRLMFENMNHAIALHTIKPIIDRTFTWADLPAALHYMESQQHFGKICLSF